jgi:hypothetical protein
MENVKRVVIERMVGEHIKGAHDLGGYLRDIFPIFFRADHFIEHLLANHSAKRGNWLISELQACAQTDGR